MDQTHTPATGAYLLSLGIITLLCGYLYYLMEWLFFYFRPSMFSYLDVIHSVAVALVAPLPLVVIGVMAVLLLTVLMLRAPGTIPLIGLPLRHIALLIPGLILSCTTFLLIDNFTYTLLRFASPSANSLLVKSVYWLLFIGLVGYFVRRLMPAMSYLATHIALQRQLSTTCAVLLSLSLVMVWLSYQSPQVIAHIPAQSAVQVQPESPPNIIVFSADGVNSNHVSVYGYARQTTPFLEQIANESMVFHHHWTNSAKTTGAMGAMLSGKYPTRTRVIFRPDTFRGQDMYQHLPGLLKQAGYFNIDITLRYYVDPVDLKIRNGFDYANRRHVSSRHNDIREVIVQRWPDSVQFWEETWQRLYQRLAHLTGHAPMAYPHQLVNGGLDIPKGFSDRDRVNQLITHIATAPRPYFANVHLLGPHGNKFAYETPVFTDTKHQPQMWMLDHYDNAIRQWDTYAQEIYQLLIERGELDNTILIFTSDHGIGHSIDQTLPLLIRFPHREPSGVVVQPSQRVDIAPTLLGYLSLPIPEWMDGQDLLATSRVPKPIFIATSPDEQIVGMGEWKSAASVRAPFYTLGTLSMALCGRLYSLNLNQPEAVALTHTLVHPPDNRCGQRALSQQQAYQMLTRHLSEMGYDVSMLPAQLN
ncbi:sulfatase-like hydrolase/transferase [Vibrio proteolyticus]|uniref:Sulfatase N-terminal domain-containing protein n=1 Tax=Vibrio proteolyticus NBRC 13287 TaxID=1219065 RepID=U3BSC8_VIBPR|nr:sulfatase-like hydrolase/transferase [Vibrio proteolyticus]GAD69378.1 hypothetical protein VPR01S_28_00330 [Vibrio proteolyticus NBRC 13287]